jgi:hypothetical protein
MEASHVFTCEGTTCQCENLNGTDSVVRRGTAQVALQYKTGAHPDCWETAKEAGQSTARKATETTRLREGLV